MNPAEKIDVVENQYYQVHYLLSKEGDKWLARVRVTRRDTGEYLNEGFTVYDHGKKNVKEKAADEIASTLIPSIEALGCPPEWDTEVRRILVECYRQRTAILNFRRNCNKEHAEEGEEGLSYARFWQQLIKDVSVLSYRVEQLNREERLNLLLSPDQVFDKPLERWKLVDWDSRHMIFSYFGNPSRQEVIAHESQLSKLKDRQDQGW